MALGDDSPLALDPESMRRLGYRTVDMLVDRIAGPPGPVVRTASPEELRQRLMVPPPEDPVTFDELLEGLERDVLPFVARISHPGYLAFIPGEGACVCTRSATRRDGRAGSRLLVRSDALVAGAGGTRARVQARPGSRHPDRRTRPDARGSAPQRGSLRRGRPAAAADGGRERRDDGGRRHRPLPRPVRGLPRARHLARASTTQ
jgi:hypothetical protein